MAVTPRRGRKILRESNRRDRRDLISGFLLAVDVDGSSWALRADGVPTRVLPYCYDAGATIDPDSFRALVREITGIDRLPA